MIGNHIAKIRKSRGFTLSELADKSNVSKSYLSNIERNLNQNPSIQVLEKIAHVLQVEISSLLTPLMKQDQHQIIENEWIEFVKELKKSGLKKDQIHEYKTLIEFIRWQNSNEGS